jgi:hypothetical protein
MLIIVETDLELLENGSADAENLTLDVWLQKYSREIHWGVCRINTSF